MKETTNALGSYLRARREQAIARVLRLDDEHVAYLRTLAAKPPRARRCRL
ncbi:hypothetical protein [Nesterenkonia haasae]|nr:hypothetical protein [Nesterenkonia haasae]